MSDARKIYDFMDELGMKPTPWQLQFLERWLESEPPKLNDMRFQPTNRPKLSKRDVLRIREMKRNGCTQADIAECMDVHPATISRTCRGIYHK